MKIKKNKSVNASEEIIVVDDTQCCDTGLPTEGTVCCKYEDAICNIQCAIEILAAHLKDCDDQVAKDSIANLSVVLMDLKSNC